MAEKKHWDLTSTHSLQGAGALRHDAAAKGEAMTRRSMDHSNTSVQSQVAVGTACAPCKAKGHWCPAYEIIDGRALCLHCVDGVDCPKTPRDGSPISKLEFAVAAALAVPAAKVGGRKPGTPYKVEERERAKAMLLSGMSLKATAAASGLSKNTISRLRAEMPGLPRAGKGGVPKGTMAARRAAVDVKVSVEENGMGAHSKQIFSKLAEEHAVFSAPAAVMAPPEVRPLVQPEGKSAAKSEGIPAAGYEVVDMSMVPGRKPQVSPYDEAIEKLKLLPLGKALMRSFATEELATVHREGICRRARVAGMAVCSKHDGATIWVWRKA